MRAIGCISPAEVDINDYGALAQAEHFWLLVYPGIAVGVYFLALQLTTVRPGSGSGNQIFLYPN